MNLVSSISKESLSTISVSSDDCTDLQYTAKRIVTIWIQSPIELFSIVPAQEAVHDVREGVTRFDERECQTIGDGKEWKDNETQTSGGHKKTTQVQVDLWMIGREVNYEESACERMLRQISADAHKEQLREWVGDVPSKDVSFSIRPLSQEARTTLRVTAYNEEYRTFVILLQIKESLMIELRSLTNLLCSISSRLDDLSTDSSSLLLATVSSFIACASDKVIIVKNISKIDESIVIKSNDIIKSIFFTPKKDLLVLNRNGNIQKLNKEGKRLINFISIPSLYSPSYYAQYILSRIYLITKQSILSIPEDSPLDYEGYQKISVLESDIVKELDMDYFILFSKQRQSVYIYREDDPRCIQWSLSFGENEFIVDVTSSQGIVYTLTVDGIITKWELRPQGRKRRSAVFKTGMEHSMKLLQIFDRKFAICSRKMLGFYLFAEEKC